MKFLGQRRHVNTSLNNKYKRFHPYTISRWEHIERRTSRFQQVVMGPCVNPWTTLHMFIVQWMASNHGI